MDLSIPFPKNLGQRRDAKPCNTQSVDNKLDYMGLIRDSWVERTLYGIYYGPKIHKLRSMVIVLERNNPYDEEHLTLATHA